MSGGAPRCIIVVVGYERRELIDSTLRTGARGIESVRATLTGASGGLSGAMR